MRGKAKVCSFVLGGCLIVFVVACGRTEQGGATPPPERVGLANPASRKCVDDGYTLEPVLGADGAPVEYNCVDPGSGKRCKEWDYFRGDCHLRATPER